MASRKTEQSAQRIIEDLKGGADLATCIEDICEKTAKYARCSGTVRYMFQQTLVSGVRNAGLQLTLKDQAGDSKADADKGHHASSAHH